MHGVSESADPPYHSATLHVQIPADDPNVPVVYANNVGVTFSPHDMTLHFSWYAVPPTSQPPEDGVLQATVRLVTKVSIPLSLVRPLAELLRGQATAWENSFGGKIHSISQRPSQEAEREPDAARSNE